MASSLSPLLCLLFLLSYPFALAVFGLNEEGLSLLSFKASIKEDPAGSLTNWSSADSNPCSWHGITCKEGKVVSVSIPMKRLEGFISPSLGSLSNLRHLNLRKNKLYGKLSSELFGAQRLQSLVLSGNSLSGSLPSEIGDLSYLQNLDLSNNSFNGSLPNSLIQCKRLRTLVLSHNNFSSSLPRDFGRSFVQLEKLDLSYNRLIGLIPQDIGKLSNLQGTADFSHNLFSGPIPASLGNLPEKVYIDLTYNNLSGPIPPDGPLENRGPTAFIGNPGLCGPPLKNPCSDNVSGVGPYLPINYPPPASESGDDSSRSSSRGLSRNAVAAIVASDVVGLSLIAIVFFHCYKRAMSSTGKEGGGSSDKGLKGRKECTCFRKDESEALSDNVEHLDLIPLDNQLGFNLDELLKSSAFILGKSRMGIVYKVVLEDGLTMAVRRLGEGGSQRLKEFQAEVEAIGKIRHPNIVTLRAYYWSIDEKLLIYDYIPNGNLSTAIHGKAGMVSFQPLSWVVRLNIMKGIAKCLAFLHDISPKKYVHGDLKPNNILLGLHMEPYISDFGVGRLASIAGGSPLLQSNRTATEKSDCQQSEIMASPVIRSGTCYQAPEALKSLKPSQKWDVYSYGVILVELISGRSPALLGTSKMDLAQWIQCHIEEKKLLFNILDPFLASEKDRDDIIPVVKIALACVQANPERRPPMRSVVDTLERLVNAS